MSRIAHGKIRRHRKSLDARAVLGHRACHRAFVERRRLLAGRDVAARDADHQAAAAGTQQTRALDHRIIEADEQRADGAEAIFDDRIRCKRGRHGHETDVAAAGVGRKQFQHGANRLADADGEVPGGRQRLGARNDPAAIDEQHGVGKRSAGVEAEPEILCRIDRAHRILGFLPRRRRCAA